MKGDINMNYRNMFLEDYFDLLEDFTVDNINNLAASVDKLSKIKNPNTQQRATLAAKKAALAKGLNGQDINTFRKNAEREAAKQAKLDRKKANEKTFRAGHGGSSQKDLENHNKAVKAKREQVGATHDAFLNSKEGKKALGQGGQQALANLEKNKDNISPKEYAKKRSEIIRGAGYDSWASGKVQADKDQRTMDYGVGESIKRQEAKNKAEKAAKRGAIFNKKNAVTAGAIAGTAAGATAAGVGIKKLSDLKNPAKAKAMYKQSGSSMPFDAWLSSQKKKAGALSVLGGVAGVGSATAGVIARKKMQEAIDYTMFLEGYYSEDYEDYDIYDEDYDAYDEDYDIDDEDYDAYDEDYDIYDEDYDAYTEGYNDTIAFLSMLD